MDITAAHSAAASRGQLSPAVGPSLPVDERPFAPFVNTHRLLGTARRRARVLLPPRCADGPADTRNPAAVPDFDLIESHRLSPADTTGR